MTILDIVKSYPFGTPEQLNHSSHLLNLSELERTLLHVIAHDV